MIRITDIRMPLLACTVALSGAAFAGELSPGTQAFNAADANESGDLTKEEFATTLAEGSSEKKINKSFKKADRNKDEVVTLDEYLIFVGEEKPPTKKQLAFAAADTDENGVLSLEEYVAASQGKGPYIVAKKRFLLSDSEDEGSIGVLTFEEWSGKRRKPAKGEFLAFDLANEETEETPEALTPSEFAKVLPKNTSEEKLEIKFNKLDDNEDGLLTKDEWNPGAPKTAPAPVV